MTTTNAPAVPRANRTVLPWAAAWTVVGIGWATLVTVLVTDVWPKRPEMGDRYLIAAVAVGLVFVLSRRWRGTPRLPAAAGLLAVAAGAAACPPAWYLIVLVGPRTLLVWWLAVALTLATIGLLVADHGRARARVMLFPIAFGLFALPTPDSLQSWLFPSLKAVTTAGAAAVLPWLGVAAQRSGFTLTLPSGKLGVVDACSGALSLPSLLAIAVLTAYVRVSFRRDLNLPSAWALVVLTIPIVVVSNTIRVIVSGVLQEFVGSWAVEGAWHEALGYLAVVVGFGLIVGVSQLLAGPAGAAPPIFSPQRDSGGRPRGGWAALAVLIVSAATCLWAEQFRQDYSHVTDLRAIGRDLPPWTGEDRPIPPDVAEMLKCDQLFHRVYEDRFGHTVEVYLMYWATPASTAHMHHPDVCWPARGCTLAAGRVRPVGYAVDREPIGASVRHYDNEFGQREVVFYWTQAGNVILPDGRDPAEQSSEYRWVFDMLRGRQPPERASRLSVLLGAVGPVGSAVEQEARLASLCGPLAADVYRVCPWARPTR
jgi:exosortase